MRSFVLQWICIFITMPAGGVSGCGMTDEVCEFWLVLEHRMTMMKHNIAVFPANGNIYRYDVTNISAADPLSTDDVITADGWEDQRLVLAVNGTVPGPPIEVYEGQTVIVHVKNLMTSASTSVHWHGLHQPDTPWMDGVGFITQCPIQPGQSFTYRFMATPRGTFWYHSHVGTQRSMGLYGAFVIREKKLLEMPERIMILSDWNHDWDSDLAHTHMVYGMYEHRHKLSNTGSLDGAHYSMFRFQSGLINGKGRFYDASGKHNGAPLEVFNVQKGLTYRFRVISAGNLYPFRISIDEHNLTIVASDGYDIREQRAESFIINPGERFDFIIHADRDVNNYWIRAKTLEVNMNHTAEAILRYDLAATEDPTTRQQQCTVSDECIVLNCPFTYYPSQSYTRCVRFDHLKSKANNDSAPSYIPGQFKEYFLNFAFPGYPGWTPGSVNGHAFDFPTVSALTQPHELYSKCGEPDCGPNKVCKCSYALDLNHGDTVQMVFTNMGSGKGWSHPIHMHGHSFYVLKMGYGRYNETTGKLLGDNEDIDCRGKFCNDATWSNSSWKDGNVHGLELTNPPRKDTIIVPTSGYVVVRIRADNPGVWFMHCHIELHNLDGMAMFINESFPNHPAPPPDFPECRNYEPEKRMYSRRNESIDEKMGKSPETIELKIFWVVVGCLFFLVILELIIIACIYVTNKKKSSDKYEMQQVHKNKAFHV
ncbi:laccase-25-like [Gigantopelta aegis]|uniref:laccase-25-like n=1 Tax=Gigantopelta aegis TaxID=1735272 RepID=UPI001B88826F|nr:laccase-25-like [Gigantopelta aegis]